MFVYDVEGLVSVIQAMEICEANTITVAELVHMPPSKRNAMLRVMNDARLEAVTKSSSNKATSHLSLIELDRVNGCATTEAQRRQKKLRKPQQRSAEDGGFDVAEYGLCTKKVYDHVDRAMNSIATVGAGVGLAMSVQAVELILAVILEGVRRSTLLDFRVMDVGSGYTYFVQTALAKGAKRVYAIDFAELQSIIRTVFNPDSRVMWLASDFEYTRDIPRIGMFFRDVDIIVAMIGQVPVTNCVVRVYLESPALIVMVWLSPTLKGDRNDIVAALLAEGNTLWRKTFKGALRGSGGMKTVHVVSKRNLSGQHGWHLLCME